MATYKVLRPIEHNKKLYVPAGESEAPKAKSAGHGGDISVETSGLIELSPEEAAKFTNGQIQLHGKGAQAMEAGPVPLPTPIKQ